MAESELVLIKRRHGTIFLHEGYQYNTKRKFDSGITVWECVNRKKKKCKGRIKTKINQILNYNPHSCERNDAKNEIDLNIYKLKRELTTQNYPNVPQTYNSMVAEFEDSGLNIIQEIPNFNSIKTSLYKHRNDTAEVPKLKCNMVEEVKIPPKYEGFLLADYLFNGQRIIIFCTEYARQILCEIHDFLADGTYKSCPSPFDELYTIHGDLGSSIHHTGIQPLLYALMTSRSLESYEILFTLIKTRVPGWNPKTFKTDYETAAMTAIANVFPSVVVKGCYYHYNRAIWKKSEKLGIKKSQDPLQIREVALSAVLPLLPISDIEKGWEYITRFESNVPEIIQFRKYMEKQWLKKDFLSVWCVFGDNHRTTNFLEGWHYKINQVLGKNPNLMHFLGKISKDAAYYKVRNVQRKNNMKPATKRSKKTILNNEFIQQCQLEFIEQNLPVGQLLEMLRH